MQRALVAIALTFGLLLGGGYLAMAAYQRAQSDYDVTFGSSDGLWADATSNLKGRGFRVVLWNFEHYKMWANKPEVTLVRIAGPVRKKPTMIELAVPLATAPGRRTSLTLPDPTPEHRAELERRTEAAMRYWRERAREMTG